MELPKAVQAKPASNAAAMLMKRQIGCCRWFNLECRIASSIVSVFVPWSLRASVVDEGLAERWVGLIPSRRRTLLKIYRLAEIHAELRESSTRESGGGAGVRGVSCRMGGSENVWGELRGGCNDKGRFTITVGGFTQREAATASVVIESHEGAEKVTIESEGLPAVSE